MAKEHLEIYLNDHLAGSVVALELLEDLEREGTGITKSLAEIRADIEADRQELLALMRKLGIEESRTRKVSAWLTEKVARIKMRVDDKASGSLRLLESLEAIALGIHGKLALWLALSTTSEIAAELRGVDYERLAHRAQE
ncbi:MAG TPA: hypothetical protein VGL70_08780 [Candidatus Binatia bacterium]|jgi:hypothetical protein